jgi:hypothetical protein
MMPTPAERLLARLQVVPDACRAIEAAICRARLRGGGEVVVRFIVAREEAFDKVEVPAVFEPHAIESRGGVT